MSSLPPVLVTEILLNLPVKSLKRFRCLSETFRTEIDNSYFIQTHLKESIERKIRIKLIIQCDKRTLPLYVSDFADGLVEAKVLGNFPSNCLLAIVKGTCNGLLLLRTYESNGISGFSLWNPFTKEYRKLPFFPSEFVADGIPNCGFGYDSASDDYKIVIISRYKEDDKCFRVGVYSLRSNFWRIIQDLYLKHEKHDSIIGNGIFINNALYWQGCNKTGSFLSNEIFGFNLSNEMFFELPLISNAPLSFDLLKVLDNKLYLLKRPLLGELTLDVYLWVGGGDEGIGYWKKAFELGEHEEVRNADLLSVKEGGVVLFQKYGRIFCWCSLEVKTRKKFRIEGLIPSECWNLTSTACFESLVSPNNYDS